MRNIIIDFEFTGLDNTFVKDNEIIQMKVLDCETGKILCENFLADKPVNAYNRIFLGIQKYRGTEKFSAKAFISVINELTAPETFFEEPPIQIDAIFEDRTEDDTKNCSVTFYGYSVRQDISMLNKYGINIVIKDMQEMLRLCPSYEAKMAEASKMEIAYYYLTGEIPELNTHNSAKELDLLKTIYDKVITLEQKPVYSIMPYGHCAGMGLDEYVYNYRRAADGYRYNNSDILSKSLTHWIDTIDEEMSMLEENFEDEEN